MTALSVFVDLHNISLLLYKSENQFWFKNFPYIYSQSLFSTSYSEDQFYLDLFTAFCAEHDVAIESCEVLLCGFLEAPKLGTDIQSEFSKKVKIKASKSLYEVVSSIYDYYPILVNNHAVFTKDGCLSSAGVRSLTKPSNILDIDEENYYANLEFYPQIVANEIAVQIDIDSNILSLLPHDFVAPSELPVVFGGSRFTHNYIFNELDYLLMLAFLKKPGIYGIRRDTNNALILISLLKLHAPQATVSVDIPHEATVIVSKHAIEGSLHTQEGTSQLVNVEKNRLLIIPTAKDTRLNLKIKARDIGNVVRTVEGSSVGLIFDTRENKKISVQDIKNFSVGLKHFKSVGV